MITIGADAGRRDHPALQLQVLARHLAQPTTYEDTAAEPGLTRQQLRATLEDLTDHDLATMVAHHLGDAEHLHRVADQPQQAQQPRLAG